MPIQATTVPTTEYVIKLNRLLEKFVVFETVFDEYAQTCRNISLGKCLVNENLETLKLYFEQNLTVLRQFVAQAGSVEPPIVFEQINQELQNALADYVVATETMVDSLEGDELTVYQRIILGRSEQTVQRQRINQVLQAISKVSF
ncbi:hypothetical protein [Latilactobacillus fuchuensis]|jgi:hypothetical protein|uniref:DUF2383 domain-containing protein n=2 Tax=Latilactobacillus fuchuensis TaxID=164393 RepID=A0A2N9DUQ6_9LACO|nr:hypothetical protein [Latilactobacillus fuchuensis]KRL61455.1 hypothetical protein FC69_GL000672 [Latilactobacillus fuchuensis DSM 14340 = JCM 11249]SPC37945.1 conserved hypothetical protein [Latilactobacillus fuchuensis]